MSAPDLVFAARELEDYSLEPALAVGVSPPACDPSMCRRVEGAFLVFGVLSLLQFNFLASSVPLFQLSFGEQWGEQMMQVYSWSSLVAVVGMVFCGSRLPRTLALQGAFVLGSVVPFLLAGGAAVLGPARGGLAAALLAVGLVGVGFSGVFMSALFGFQAELAPVYKATLSNALALGQGLAGLVAFAVCFAAGLLLEGSWQHVAMLVPPVLVSFVSLWRYRRMLAAPSVRKLDEELVEADAESGAPPPSCAQGLWDLLAASGRNAASLGTVFLTLLGTFLVFPVVTGGLLPASLAPGSAQAQAYGVATIGVFQVFDTVGRYAARFNRPGKWGLRVLVVLRFGFAPLFLAMYTERCGLLGTIFAQLGANALFALTNGLCLALGMGSATTHAGDADRPAVARASVLMLQCGIMVGSMLTGAVRETAELAQC